jgi:hypothetical protein
MTKYTFSLVILLQLIYSKELLAQDKNYWQQRANYEIDVKVNVDDNRITGNEQIIYINNSPNQITKLYFHLYWNAFQPNSMMDIRSRSLMDGPMKNDEWDDLVRDRIFNLKETEIGYQKIASVKVDGQLQPFEINETIMEVTLKNAVKPNSTIKIEVAFEAQVPLQIRRSGRDNPETGVRFTMSQWYPKLCEYDVNGWHPDPYIAREFYGVWGDYRVRIEINKDYFLDGTGFSSSRTIGNFKKWEFIAKNVHEFMWVADPYYKQIIVTPRDGLEFYITYRNESKDAEIDRQWSELAETMKIMLPFIENHYGVYFYSKYSFIQGGDGGMEYSMACLLKEPNIGTAFHEFMHAWFQGALAIDETQYAWMDEGFARYAENILWNRFLEIFIEQHPENERVKGMLEFNKSQKPSIQHQVYDDYYKLQKSGYEEPLSTHSNHYNTNYAYEVGAYQKGAVFFEQLSYIIGERALERTFKSYYNQWAGYHPRAENFIRIAEKESDMQLDWYLEYWISSTKSIDYAIDNVWSEKGQTKIQLSRQGSIPMPIDLTIRYKNGAEELIYIPNYLMFGEKSAESTNAKFSENAAWR